MRASLAHHTGRGWRLPERALRPSMGLRRAL